MPVELDNKVSRLEKVLEQHITSTNEALKSLSQEMKEFKDEMKEFKDEMKEFKEEMKDFKVEMKEFKDESREDRRNMNKQWGHLANKMGTIVEDIIRPGIRPALKKYFHSDPIFIGNHIHKKIKETGIEGEFDIVAMDETRIYVVEVKSSPDQRKISKLTDQKVPHFRQLFPEYDAYPIVPILGSLSFPDELIPHASESGVYLMGYREWDYLDILNFDEVHSSN